MNSESEVLKIVRRTVADCRNFDRILAVSGMTPEMPSGRLRHCHELFEIRFLFGMSGENDADYTTLREIRLSPTGVLHPGLFDTERRMHITIRVDVDMLYYLRGLGSSIAVSLHGELESYGVVMAGLMNAFHAFVRGEITDAGHLQLELSCRCWYPRWHCSWSTATAGFSMLLLKSSPATFMRITTAAA